MSTISIISPHATDKAWQGRQRRRPGGSYVVPPPPNEENRLNFKLKELLEDAERVMSLEGPEEPKKWRGVKGLMKRMQSELPYLIDDDTRLELCFEDKIGDETCEMLGPLSYSQFIEALRSKDTMNKHHQYIASHYEPIGSGDQQRETLRAEDKLLMLYSALSYELERHEGYMALFDDDEAETPADNVVRMPHFGMESSENAQKHWETVYEWLADRKWLWRAEVDYHEWVYACCGQQKAHEGPIVWHGSKAALAYIIRTKFNGQWEVAKQIFCLAEGKTFNKTFWNTNGPVPKVAKSIDIAFSGR